MLQTNHNSNSNEINNKMANFKSFPQISDEDSWKQISIKPNNYYFAHTEIVNVVIDLELLHSKEKCKIYFLQTNLYDEVLDNIQLNKKTGKQPLSLENQFDYFNNQFDLKKRFIIGKIIRFLDQNLWVYEVMECNKLNLSKPSILTDNFEQLKKLCYFGEYLYFHPNSALLEKNIEMIKQAIPIKLTNKISKEIQFQPYTLGTVVGKLQIVQDPNNIAIEEIEENRILLVKGIGNHNWPPFKGLITTGMQTPLGHISLHCLSKSIPNMTLRNAFDHQLVKQYKDGDYIKLTVKRQEFSIEIANEQQIKENHKQEKMYQSRTRKQLHYNLNSYQLYDLRLDNPESLGAERLGCKAFTLSRMASFNLQNCIQLNGFIIPIAWYHNHVKDLNITQTITQQDFQSNRKYRIKCLQRIRAAIMNKPLDARLIKQTQQKIQNLYLQIGYQSPLSIRSSSNAEELPGFIGIGLYTSKITKKNPTKKALESCIKEIYSSIWKFKAYEEREECFLEQKDSKMAILVQPFYDQEILKATSVCITTNPYNPNFDSYFINSQSMKGSVTDSIGVSEQLIVYSFDNQIVSQTVSKSSLMSDNPVLDERDLKNVYNVLQYLDSKFKQIYINLGFTAVDCELLITNDHRIFIEQVRPFKSKFI
ncbi:phosphoenolpyruvate synthase [Anaeramoeba flamelloides]|uniref:Phosphoenolpyruvate synthase n=1 Tax=Anaeramoeba flamelloides TaxID=1746091 RepID=A0AAV7YJD3_9EUKA|nr:phosphoenolpyruvate synthase [Anaeramoeba flamelloides]